MYYNTKGRKAQGEKCEQFKFLKFFDNVSQKRPKFSPSEDKFSRFLQDFYCFNVFTI